MVKKILTEDMENFIYKNHNLMTISQIADYLDLKKTTVSAFGHRKKLTFKRVQRIANPDLTERETQIAELVSKGLTNSEISKILCIAYTTLKTHIYAIYQKYNIQCEKGKDKSAYRVKLALEYLKRHNKLNN